MNTEQKQEIRRLYDLQKDGFEEKTKELWAALNNKKRLFQQIEEVTKPLHDKIKEEDEHIRVINSMLKDYKQWYEEAKANWMNMVFEDIRHNPPK